MLVSLKWLNDYCELVDLSPEQIADTLTQLGHEVESITALAPLPQGVVVGEIKAIAKHPQADSLNICQVDVGQVKGMTIVCGAANARQGLKVAVARAGVVLPNGSEIKKGSIRGQESEGMLCSEKELGLSDAHAGIWELASSWQVGAPVSQYVDTQDWVLELSLTPNRADCLGLKGLARDLAAKLGRPLKTLVYTAESLGAADLKTSDHLDVAVLPEAGCARFTALYIGGVRAFSSPLWLQSRLKAAGLRPINVIVDVTNYVMLEWGQPLHAYDARFIQGGRLEVRAASLADKLTTLDRQELQLAGGDLLICDGEKPVALAGIMGGADAEVREDTEAIFVEVAHFDPMQIRKTAKRLGLHTEASYRFERGVDIAALRQVAWRFAGLLDQCLRQQGVKTLQAAKELVEVYPQSLSPTRIALRLSRVRSFLSLPHLSLEACVARLESLAFTLIDKTAERMLFEVPSFRHDISREVDLIEELARLEGFDKIPYELPRMQILPQAEHGFIGFCERLKHCLAHLGLTEIISFPFRSLAEYKKLGLSSDHPLWPSLELANPLSEESAFMQSSLLPAMLQAVRQNRHHGQQGSKLFELARVYVDKQRLAGDARPEFAIFRSYGAMGLHVTARARAESHRPSERTVLAGLADTPFIAKAWDSEQETPHFFHAKAWLESLAASFGLAPFVWERPNPLALPFLHPGASAVWRTASGVMVAYLGELHPQVALDWGLEGDAPLVFELDVEGFYHELGEKLKIDPEPQRFPAVVRDFAFVLEQGAMYADLERAVWACPKLQYLKKLHLFDLYEGSSLASGKKSLAAELTFAAKDKTLTDKEVESEVQRLLQWLKKEIGAELR